MAQQVEPVSLSVVKRSFWRRQFVGDTTGPQLAYDVMFGVVMPILCFMFDPIVFSGRGFGNGLVPLANLSFIVYLFSALSIVTLTAWLLAPRALKTSGGLIAGVLLSGALCSFLIGVLILPLSLLGLMFLIGVLGFTPFFTALVYLRNGIRAMKTAEPHVGHAALVGTLLAGAFAVIAVPLAAHAGVNRVVSQSIDDLMRDDPRAVERAVGRLKYVGWSADLDKMVWSYSKEQDSTRKRALARAYREITGSEIESRLAILLD